MYLRRSDYPMLGCLLFVGVGGLVLVTFVVLVWLVAHGRQLAFGFGSIAAVVALVYFAMMRRPGEHRVGTLPTPIADVKPGAVHTAGLVGFTEQPRHAPLGAPPCVFYRIVVEADGNVLFEGRSADELAIGDGTTAHVTVHLDGATWRLGRSHELESSPARPNDEVVRYLAERGLPHDKHVRVRVEWIAPHELVFVRGAATERTEMAGVPSEYRAAQTTEIEMRAAPHEPLVLGLEPLAG